VSALTPALSALASLALAAIASVDVRELLTHLPERCWDKSTWQHVISCLEVAALDGDTVLRLGMPAPASALAERVYGIARLAEGAETAMRSGTKRLIPREQAVAAAIALMRPGEEICKGRI
jgi:hypothetical protein